MGVGACLWEGELLLAAYLGGLGVRAADEAGSDAATAVLASPLLALNPKRAETNSIATHTSPPPTPALHRMAQPLSRATAT